MHSRLLAALAVVVVTATACTKQVTPVEPTVWLRYADDDPADDNAPALEREVAVGGPITVTGLFSATCGGPGHSLFTKNDKNASGPEYISCKRETPLVAVRCAGPCTVLGNQVTPTSAGAFEVTIELTAPKHHHVETRSLTALVPDTLRIENCLEGLRLIKPGTPPLPCVLESAVIRIRVMGQGHDLGAAATVSFAGRERTGRFVMVDALVGTTPSGVMAGEVDLDVRYGSLAGQLRVRLARR